MTYSLFHFIDEKLIYLKEIIRNTISSINKNKFFDIFSNNDISISINILNELYEKTNDIGSKLIHIKQSNVSTKIDTIENNKNKNIMVNATHYEEIKQYFSTNKETENNDILLNKTTQPEPIIAAKQSNSIEDTKSHKKQTPDQLIEQLQKIIDKLSMVICGFGTKYIDDLLFISFGTEYKNIKIENAIIQTKYNLIKKHVQPIGYKIIHWKQNKNMVNTSKETEWFACSNKMTEETIRIEESNMFECFDIESSVKLLYLKIHGIRIVIQNEKLKKTLIIHGILDDIQIDCFNNSYIDHRKTEIKKMYQQYNDEEKEIMNELIETMTFKDYLIYGNNDIKKKMITIITEKKNVKNTRLDITIKKFMELQPFYQINMIINLLICNKDDEIKYICFILYEILTLNINETTSNESNVIYDNLPWKIKKHFKDIIKYTIKFTNDMTQKYDINKITLEHQIHLMKAPENVKEKAMAKLKEIKGKSDDSNTKSKQYIEGLLKIPFGIYKEEPILKKMKELNTGFQKVLSLMKCFFPETIIEYTSNGLNILNIIQTDSTKINITKKEKYTNQEIIHYIQIMKTWINENVICKIESLFETMTTKQMTPIIQYINFIKKERKDSKIKLSNQSKQILIQKSVLFLKENSIQDALELFQFIQKDKQYSLTKTITEMNTLNKNTKELESNITSIVDILDESVYGHNHAKNQLMKIFGQWINGEQTGYCFGFEGSPGVGKTSLAKKGLSKCLTDENNTTRPFAFIALGGSSNGSTIEGHGYTYVNSCWGRIIDILMESKCMNPIIYIDELDKVSKSEHGREIIGILTHLIDSTQNDCFQDKYFSGIDIDLSKALIIFSYNDPEQIDRVLLDRIHRIKFDNLTIEEKKVIVRKHILPEINTKMGFENTVNLTDEMIEYIIIHYTNEPGVRKLKEILFDIYGEINLNILKGGSQKITLPVDISIENLEENYLKKKNKIHEKKIHHHPTVGVINGLWANALGRGGIIPIETLYYPSSTFLELKLTGLQGDVMKESMNVAKTLAWNMTPKDTKLQLIEEFETTKCQGIHIHCPEGSVSKDGPSAGAAITSTLFSLFNKKEIRNDIAITGEIDLQGNITEIGGLDMKIDGGIRAGVKHFLYPEANHSDFLKWKEKNETKSAKIVFDKVSTIKEVFQYIFA